MGNRRSQVLVSKDGDAVMRVPLLDGRTKPPTESNSLNDGALYHVYKQGKAFQLLEEYGRELEIRNRNNRDEIQIMLRIINQLAEGNLSRVTSTVGDRVAILGSQDETIVHRNGGNNGMFTAILAAYNYHWAFRTSPDDWWFCAINRVAKAIDRSSDRESVRRYFVSHNGKRNLSVKVDTLNIHDIEYDWFFAEMSKQIDENINVPGYVGAITADFSTTSSTLRIVSQITLMSSVQEFFDFSCQTCCGIPVAEMLGTENDWVRLLTKLKCLKKQLEPISEDIGLTNKWWAVAEKVFTKLLCTYQGKPDKRWWSHVMSYKHAHFSGQSNGWEGWIVDFLEGPGSRADNNAFTSGLVTVPLTFESPITGAKDTAALVAGMLGFTLQHDTEPGRPSVRPFQGWSLLLPKDSPFR